MGRGQLVPRASREVVLSDRNGNFGRLAVAERVIGAHDSLQLGEFSDHCSEKVTFAQLGRSLTLTAIPAGHCRDFSGQRAYTPRLVAKRTELRLKRHRVERFAPGRERLFAILFPEKCRVGEPGTHHAFISFTHF